MIIVDRILNGLAVCERDGKTENIPLSRITGDVCEGDILREDENGALYLVQKRETQKRRETLSARFEQIKKRNK